jgi:asparagine synthase (glutamine-hydrolysing)
VCGFCGLALPDPEARVDEELLGRMAATLAHRGPDDQGVESRAGVGLAFRRLSIIDLAGGHQPLWNEAHDVAVMCNGEIYNFRELRRELEAAGHRLATGSDAEVLVHLYEDEGPDMLRRLVGMFAVCVADFREPGRPRVLLARDRLGIKPLYFAEAGGGLAWASEPKALLEGGLGERRMRGEALVDYLVQGFCGGPDGAFVGLQRLGAGELVEWDAARGARRRTWWDLPLEGVRDEVAGEEILEWIDRVVGDRLVADVPLGAFLSGGVDSTAVVTSMAAASSEPVRACSVGFEERSHDELDLARRTASRLGLEHHTAILRPDPRAAIEVLPWFFDEPLADSSTVPTWMVSGMAREHVTVALAGDGGDEVFAGYRRHVFDVAEGRLRAALGAPGRAACRALGAVWPRMAWAPRPLRARSLLENLGREPGRAYYASMTQLDLAEARRVLAPELRDALAGHDPYEAFAAHYERPRGCEPLYRAQYADFKTWLPDRILTKTDRASMAVSLEVRVPLLDHRFVERFAPLATRHKVRGGRGKHALREALRPRVPGEVLDGAKRGFDTPLRAWIQGPLGGAVAEAIEELPSEVFDRGELRRRLAGHRAGVEDHAQLLWSLLVFEHWRRRHGVLGVSA